MRLAATLALLLAACASPEPGCDATLDADGDGLDDCAELEAGTDPNKADTDTDGLTDLEELECTSDPLNVNSVCYTCGWEHLDPGDLGPVGPAVGQTVANLKLFDQCGQRTDLHDFAGSYHILFMTTQWCTACLAEASELEQRTRDYSADLGIEFSYIVALFQDVMGAPPDAEVAAEYAEVIGIDREIPVLSDRKQELLDVTPYDGETLPGKCVLSPEMELLDCTTGHGDDLDLIDGIRAHAGL